MIKDSEKFADEDKKVKDRVDAKNELESYAYSLKKNTIKWQGKTWRKIIKWW